MNDEELKAKIAKLEAQNEKLTEEIEDLKKQLAKNKASDDQRHKELQELQRTPQRELNVGKDRNIKNLNSPIV